MRRHKRTQEKAVFLQLLRDFRVGAKLRQQDLATKLREPQSFISKLESGERRIDVLELREVCSALGVSLGDFVDALEGRIDDLEDTKLTDCE